MLETEHNLARKSAILHTRLHYILYTKVRFLVYVSLHGLAWLCSRRTSFAVACMPGATEKVLCDISDRFCK